MLCTWPQFKNEGFGNLEVAYCNRHVGGHCCGLYNIIGTLFPPLLNENGSFCYCMLWDVPFCIRTTHKDGWNLHCQISVSIFKTFVQRVQILFVSLKN